MVVIAWRREPKQQQRGDSGVAKSGAPTTEPTYISAAVRQDSAGDA